MTVFPHHIFREYDIRGIADTDINETFAYQLGRSFASMVPSGEIRPISIGRDVRLSGQGLQNAVIQGILDAGFDVIDLGMIPTPLAYYSVFKLHTAGCIVVTASHNPSEYNGFKLMLGEKSLHGEDIQKLKELMQQKTTTLHTKGQLSHHDITSTYHDFVSHDCVLSKPLKVVIDAGNGPAGMVAAPLYRRMGCDVIELYCEPDGSFPNHHPDPTVVENMQDLAQSVRHHQADLGIAFDGDGDRIGIVNEHGEIIWGDMLLLILARELLKLHPNATIISEIKSSELMYADIKKRGGNAIMWRTGHSPIKAKMQETGALLAGEMSGHIFFADRFYGFDDAIYAGARTMQILAATSSPLSQLLADVPHSEITPELRSYCPDDQKFIIIEQAKAYFRAQGYHIIDVDGIRIQCQHAWGLLRASNTQPALVMRFEGKDLAHLKQVQTLITDWLYQQI
ncbi:MAG: phosphomannomutase/phosphoglucomutase [Mariprofundaceae bacterium]